jgi:hypothetical protein
VDFNGACGNCSPTDAKGGFGRLALVMLEEFDLPKTLCGFFASLVRPAQILPLLGRYPVAAFHFLDHLASP